MPRPQSSEFPSYFARYISQVATDSVAEAVQRYAAVLNDFYTSLPEEKADYRYAEGKWTIKELLQHVIDAERIFAYRILRISRKDTTPLASFDEDSYVQNAQADKRSLASLKEEFLAVRRSSDLLLASLSEEQLAEKGTASNLPVTANAIGFILFGHLLHHKAVLEERYLQG
ncbi:MAG: DinB family protein [Chitinophagaceae bacterium]|nr:DinB family protein [Chitinophagaceae bacterium]MCA6453391.1 DinB family protein [Chitinophagaceae bacterium]MCA6454622.1 DinB family protein [Chitinophagaceae bacterium]MCA6459333.1 DinB family protein [Chitinophagaceae bacterium]MCA6464863.1 DinB family protein [Chitinophagaceae bacterium]